MKMLLDSNIIVYSINSASPKHSKAQKFIKENQDSFAVAHQNIFESLRILTHPKFPSPMAYDSALSAVNSIASQLYVVSPALPAYPLGIELIKRHKLTSNKIFDAYLAATAISNGIYTIATDNTKDFKIFGEMNVLNPF